MDDRHTVHASDRIRSWIADWRRASRTRSEIESMRREDLGQLAADLGISPRELIGAIPFGTGSSDLMPERMQALGLDPEGVRTNDPATYRDLERVCGQCRSKSRCERDLARGDVESGMRGYCANAATLDALVVEAT